MTPAPLRVIKLGGSLLDWPGLSDAVRTWRAGQPPATDVMIVGGGAIVEAIRRLDQRQRLSPVAAHWLSIRAMSLTAALAAELLDAASLVRSRDQLRLSPAAGLQILDVEHLLREDEGSAESLPCGWEVTSDSIAARVATLLGVRELVLLKSALQERVTGRDTWARQGFVDEYFPIASRAVPVRCVNLRDPAFPEMTG